MSAKNCFRVLFAFVLLFGLFANFKPASASGLYDGFCPNAPARLKPGDIAVVSDKGGPNGLNLRVQPALGQQIIMSIPLYERVTIIAGPKCQDGYRWFEVGYNGQDGWSAEVGSDGVYNLDPNSPPTTQSGQSQGGLQQQSNNWPDGLMGTWENQMACPSNPNNNCDVRVEIARDASGQLHITVYENSVLVGTGVQQATQGCGSGSGMCSPEYVFTGNYIVSLPDRGPVLDFYNSNGWLGELNYSGPPPQGQTQTPTEMAPNTQNADGTPFGGQEEQPAAKADWCSLPFVGQLCNFEIKAGSINCGPQCVVTAIDYRPDIRKWSTPYTPKAILSDAQNGKTFPWNGQSERVRVRDSNEAVQAGDLVIWPKSCGGVPFDGGHIGYVESVQGILITISDSNWDKPDSPSVCSVRHHKQIMVLPCMKFISSPYNPDISTPQSIPATDKCSQKSGLDWVICKLGG